MKNYFFNGHKKSALKRGLTIWRSSNSSSANKLLKPPLFQEIVWQSKKLPVFVLTQRFWLKNFESTT